MPQPQLRHVVIHVTDTGFNVQLWVRLGDGRQHDSSKSAMPLLLVDASSQECSGSLIPGYHDGPIATGAGKRCAAEHTPKKIRVVHKQQQPGLAKNRLPHDSVIQGGLGGSMFCLRTAHYFCYR